MNLERPPVRPNPLFQEKDFRIVPRKHKPPRSPTGGIAFTAACYLCREPARNRPPRGGPSPTDLNEPNTPLPRAVPTPCRDPHMDRGMGLPLLRRRGAARLAGDGLQ